MARDDVVEFEHVATLLPPADRLAPLLGPGPHEVPEHLEAAVLTYADGHFAIAEAARALRIHLNTMKYGLIGGSRSAAGIRARSTA